MRVWPRVVFAPLVDMMHSSVCICVWKFPRHPRVLCLVVQAPLRGCMYIERAMLTLDRREKELSDALGDVPHELRELPVGDVLCEYGGPDTWVAERKSACDLAASIVSGRLFEQTARLHQAGYRRIFWLIEGDLKGYSVAYESLLGACVNMTLRNQSHLIRTHSVAETAAVVKQLVEKGRCPPGVPSGAVPPAPFTKRKRDADKETVCLRQLMCVPTISERVAKKLIQQFGTLPALQRALADIDSFPRIRLDEKTCLGEARLRTLRTHLCDAQT